MGETENNYTKFNRQCQTELLKPNERGKDSLEKLITWPKSRIDELFPLEVESFIEQITMSYSGLSWSMNDYIKILLNQVKASLN